MNRDLETAILMLTRGDQVPVDIIFRLAEQGIDFSALEEKYSN